jgi:hypothetical protein
VKLVLVVAKDAVIGSLMASLIEIAGYEPAFPAADESVLQALARVKPATLLLDCDDAAAEQSELYARAPELGTRIVVFTPSRTEREVRRLASERGLPSFALPVQPAMLRRILDGGTVESWTSPADVPRRDQDGTAAGA